MKRNDWEFPYSIGELNIASKVKHDHHMARLQWWNDKKAETIDKVKAEGIEIDESLADQISNSYGRGAQVQIRNDLVKDLQECVSKIREHRERVTEYDAWLQVLSAQSATRQLLLNQNDWLFFFGDQTTGKQV